MAGHDLLRQIQDLQALPSDLHLFCPRENADDRQLYFDEDFGGCPVEEDPSKTEARKRAIGQAEERKWLTLECLTILAYDDATLEGVRTWLTDRLNHQLSSCEVCIRVFHQTRAQWRSKLLESYEDEHVAAFLNLIDTWRIERIAAGLDACAKVLAGVPPELRGQKVLEVQQSYALFESLHSAAFVRNEDLLKRHFDTPFELVQTRRRLRVTSFVPAMSRFLFSSNDKRRDWAELSYYNLKRNMLNSEFDWAVRDYLLEAMSRVQITALDVDFVPSFWRGARAIVTKMDELLITHSLRGLDLDIYKLMLEHLQLDTDGFWDLIATMTMLLEKSPTGFWDAMGAISPTVIVEQVFNSPILRKLLLRANDNETEVRHLDEVFGWMGPFMASIKPANMAPACRAFAHQFFVRLQTERYSPSTKTYSMTKGLELLRYTFHRLGQSKTREKFVGQPIVDAMLDVLEPHIELIVSTLRQASHGDSNYKQIAVDMVEEAFKLECLSLNIERQCIDAKQPSPTGPTKSRPVWSAVIGAINVDQVELAIQMLRAGKDLIGLQPYKSRSPGGSMPPAHNHFNRRFDILSKSITEILQQLNEWSPKQVKRIFGSDDGAFGVVAMLFSSCKDARSASVELLKLINSCDVRRDALRHVVASFNPRILNAVVCFVGAVVKAGIFDPVPDMVRILSDIVDALCSSTDGILRSESVNREQAAATRSLWENIWSTLRHIFGKTEEWSQMGYDKTDMINFCRHSMEFADQMFDHCDIFCGAICQHGDSTKDMKSLLTTLLRSPARATQQTVTWLRLRDEFLSDKSLTLTCKLLSRLRDVQLEIPEPTIVFLRDVVSGKVRTRLSPAERALLRQALEKHTGRRLVLEEEEAPVKPGKQAPLTKWMSTGTSGSDDPASGQRAPDTVRTIEAFRAKQNADKKSHSDAKQAAAQAEFKRKRELEKEAKKKRDAALIAKARETSVLRNYSKHTAEAGSGLEGLGVLGKDHIAKGEGAFMSSGESEDDDDDDGLDPTLFGVGNKKLHTGPKTNIIEDIRPRMPVKKRRVYRSQTDMRARLAPDLTGLHKTILGWDYYHDGAYPPKTRTDIYAAVPDVMKTPNAYKSTFEPLLILEAWQGFVKAREENSLKAFPVNIVTRGSVDAFQELSTTLTHIENKEIGISEGDIVLLCRDRSLSAESPHCLARVFRLKRKKEHIEVLYQVLPGTPLNAFLTPKGKVYGAKLQSITPLEREYGALKGLEYYDLCDEIVQAKPSPLLDYKAQHLDPLISNYRVNRAQAKAIKSAVDNDAFTLIQGPPGSGKTKTIVAIVGALLSTSSRVIQRADHSLNGIAPKKLLVCAPSNAAVDELVMRFKEGITTLNGQRRKISVLRLGRSDAINANVQDVTLDELVSRRLKEQNSNPKDAEAARKVFQEHKQVSEQFREVCDKLNSGEVLGDALKKLENERVLLSRRKTMLGTQIDAIKDKEKAEVRDSDVLRKRTQAAIILGADIICATLSGSGHDMFQNISVDFETVIVDEAAQCVELSALIPLKYGCSKCILVGDPKQLPPTVFSKEATRFQYEQSLFVRMQKNHPSDVHLLDTQYRMHPEISLFPSRTFYDGKLLDGDDMAKLRQRPWHSSDLLGPYKFFDVQGQHQAAPKGHSLINTAEIEVALQLYNRLTSDYSGDYDFKGKIGIITPYKSQLRELKSNFARRYGDDIVDQVEFNTTDAFQGRECEVIIFSCVRASPAGGIGFLQDIRRMNVGLTRAKSSLWVLGNSASLLRGQFWKLLVQDAQARGRYTSGNYMSLLQKPTTARKQPRAQPPPQPPAPQARDPGSLPSPDFGRRGSDSSEGSGRGPQSTLKRKISSSPMGSPPVTRVKKEESSAPTLKRKNSSPPMGNPPALRLKKEESPASTLKRMNSSSPVASPPAPRIKKEDSPAAALNDTRRSSLVSSSSVASGVAPSPVEEVTRPAARPVKKVIKRRPKEVNCFITKAAPKKKP